jgi:hypothetical protein
VLHILKVFGCELGGLGQSFLAEFSFFPQLPNPFSKTLDR